VGRALLKAVTADAEHAGHRHLTLWVLKENTTARGFYTKSGLTPDGAEEPFEWPGYRSPRSGTPKPSPHHHARN